MGRPPDTTVLQACPNLNWPSRFTSVQLAASGYVHAMQAGPRRFPARPAASSQEAA